MTQRQARYRAGAPSEHEYQSNVVEWSALQAPTCPELELLYAVPNGAYKSKVAAAKFKREGLKSGVPDLVLPVARKGYHGLYIEMKGPTGRISKTQKWWIARLSEQGYLTSVCWTDTEAIGVLKEYLEI